MNRKRDRLEIIRDILRAIREKDGKAKPTHVMYRANLSHKMLVQYTKELLKKGMITEVEDSKGKKSFKIKDKGFEYLKDYSMIRGFVDSYGLD